MSCPPIFHSIQIWLPLRVHLRAPHTKWRERDRADGPVDPDLPRWGIWTIQSNIFLENAESIVGTRQRIRVMSYGPYAKKWRDTVLLQKTAGEADNA